jgi:hypothetical protein
LLEHPSAIFGQNVRRNLHPVIQFGMSQDFEAGANRASFRLNACLAGELLEIHVSLAN